MGVTEAMATFVSDKCRKGKCPCGHPACTHDCHAHTPAEALAGGENATTKTGEGTEAPAAEVMPDATATSGEVQGQTIPADAGAELTPNGEGPGAEAATTAVATAAAPGPTSTDGGDSEDGHGSHVASEAPVGEFAMLPTHRIVPAAANVRRNLGDLDELATSIQTVGIIEPLIVERCADDDPEHDFHLVAGERRWTAAGMVGLALVPCVVREPIVDDDERVELMLIENLQRKDLDPLEEAEGYRRLTEFGMPQRDIAERVGCSQSHVSKRLGLLLLPEKAQAALDSGGITVEEATALARMHDEPKRIERVLKAQGGQRRYVLDDELRKFEAERTEAKTRAYLEKAGVRILEGREWRSEDWRSLGEDAWELNMAVDEHSTFDCHAAWIGHTGDPNYVCTKPTNHAGLLNDEDDDEPGADPDGANWKVENERRDREYEERDRIRAEAAAARRAAMVEAIAHPHKKLVDAFVASQLVALATDLDGEAFPEPELVCELLGLELPESDVPSWQQVVSPARTVLSEYSGQGAGHASKVTLAVALALGERLATETITGALDAVEAFYGFLGDHGHVMTPWDEERLQTIRAAVEHDEEPEAAEA